MRTRHSGMSLVEILIAIALTGLLAVLTIPKFIVSQDKLTGNNTGKFEQILQQIVLSVQLYEDESGDAVNLNNITYEKIIQDYGNYFIFKNVNGPPNAGPLINYFLLPDGTRITAQPQLFSQGYMYNMTEYNPPPLSDQWQGTGFGTSQFCGQYLQRECLYVDINGQKPPNTIGKFGDIIPIRIDPGSGKAQTLYQWTLSESGLPQATICKFVSSYDVQTRVAGASACP